MNDSVTFKRLSLSRSGGQKKKVGLIVAAARESPFPVRRQRERLSVSELNCRRTIDLAKVNGVARSARLPFLAKQQHLAVGRESHRIGPVEPGEVTFRGIVGGTDNEPAPPVIAGEKDA